jgi:oligopeptidase B
MTLVLALLSPVLAQGLEPPVAKTEPKVDSLFGTVMVDDYFWLRGKEKPEVIEYLDAENSYTEAVMKHTEQFQEDLFKELKSRIKETDLSVPVKRGAYYYYQREEEGQQYKIYCRKKGNLEAQEEVLLDVNKLAEDREFLQLGTYEISPDHSLLAFSTDTAGSERYALRIKNLGSGELYPDMIENISGNLAWANDNKTFFYTIPDDAWRPFKLYRHTLGADVADDKLVYHEQDESFWMSIDNTKSEAYLLLSIGSETSDECHYLSADDPNGVFKIIHPRQHELEYSVFHHHDCFYILTNDEAVNFRLMETPVSHPAKENWTEFVPHREAVKLDDLDLFEDFLVIYQRENGLRTIQIRNLVDGNQHAVEFPEPVYSYRGQSNPEYDTDLLRFTYRSLVTPNSVFDYNMRTHERELKKQTEVLGGFDPTEYQSERVFATAPDGSKIPISIVYRKGMVKDGSNPLYLYAYGSYGYSMDPYFSSNRISLLDRGFVFAIAHIRGGGEMGRPWYDDGKLLNKKNTFTDFIACGEHLIAEGYSSKDKLVISGGSAGGLLVGAVLNMRPDLFHVVVADVPFVDVMNTMLDASIPLTVIEYEEWGNPNEEESFKYMMSYSPYDNVGPMDYPHLLITAGLNDTRVQYWEPAKWTAKLRTMNTGSNRLLLKTNMGAGHGGASGRYDYLKDIAFEFAFVFDCLGITE